jgi:hypothetical protein
MHVLAGKELWADAGMQEWILTALKKGRTKFITLLLKAGWVPSTSHWKAAGDSYCMKSSVIEQMLQYAPTSFSYRSLARYEHTRINQALIKSGLNWGEIYRSRPEGLAWVFGNDKDLIELARPFREEVWMKDYLRTTAPVIFNAFYGKETVFSETETKEVASFKATYGEITTLRPEEQQRAISEYLREYPLSSLLKEVNLERHEEFRDILVHYYLQTNRETEEVVNLMSTIMGPHLRERGTAYMPSNVTSLFEQVARMRTDFREVFWSKQAVKEICLRPIYFVAVNLGMRIEAEHLIPTLTQHKADTTSLLGEWTRLKTTDHSTFVAMLLEPKTSESQIRDVLQGGLLNDVTLDANQLKRVFQATRSYNCERFLKLPYFKSWRNCQRFARSGLGEQERSWLVHAGFPAFLEILMGVPELLDIYQRKRPKLFLRPSVLKRILLLPYFRGEHFTWSGPTRKVFMGRLSREDQLQVRRVQRLLPL